MESETRLLFELAQGQFYLRQTEIYLEGPSSEERKMNFSVFQQKFQAGFERPAGILQVFILS